MKNIAFISYKNALYDGVQCIIVFKHVFKILAEITQIWRTFLMSKELSREDETYKYIIKKLGIHFHKRLGYDGDSIQLKNVELTPLAKDNKFMDIFYEVDSRYNVNIELQSSPVYESKMRDMYNY